MSANLRLLLCILGRHRYRYAGIQVGRVVEGCERCAKTRERKLKGR